MCEFVSPFKERHDADISSTLISKVAVSVLEQVINKSVCLVLGVNLEGQKELLGMWLFETEGVKFWLNVLTERQNRGEKISSLPVWMGLKVSQPHKSNSVLSIWCEIQ
ncbi:transposase (fragment) [Vibrio nigripulchritudo SFn27]|uniref:IS256 family transposase n=1 Tax=Vibrio nigripulchritudo TaxID=28173 RepID=UPI0003B1B6A2